MLAHLKKGSKKTDHGFDCHFHSYLKSGENRVRAVERLARHAEIVVVHDTQQQTYGWPTDWEQSKNSEHPIWRGRY